ncbi:aminotransferase class IV [Aquifex pyrophilus]
MKRTLLYGEGLFETIKWKGETKKVRRHYERMKSSADFFSYPCPSYEEFLKKIKEKTNGRKNLYVKFLLLLDGSDYYGDYPERYKTEVIVKPLPKVPERVKLGISSFRRHSRNPLFYHKTTNFLFNILVKREAKKEGFYDCLVLNEKERITETSSANILFYKDGRFYTPARESGLLWGTTIDIISEKLGVKEEKIDLNFLRDAKYVFILNSLIEVVPVSEIKGECYEVDKNLVKYLKEIINKED